VINKIYVYVLNICVYKIVKGILIVGDNRAATMQRTKELCLNLQVESAIVA
jgi:hypothetical protein